MPESGSEYSFEHSLDERKQKQKVFSEEQLPTCCSSLDFGRISLAGAGAVSDFKKKAFLYRPTSEKS